MPEADRVLERTRLLGSLVAPGIAERVFELEVDSAGQVARRLLESDLRGPFDFPQLGGLKQRTIEIAGKADRIDVLDDGSLRVVDYKLSRLPDKETSIQIAVYAHAAKALLERADSQSHRIAAAMYLAFGDEDEFEGSLGTAIARRRTWCWRASRRLPRSSTGSSPANSRRSRGGWTCAGGAGTPASAAKNIERGPMKQPSLFDAPDDNDAPDASPDAAARNVRGRSGSRRGARGLGGDRQDACSSWIATSG
jgi:hypothetical protein